jgi:hypothetical protein
LIGCPVEGRNFVLKPILSLAALALLALPLSAQARIFND